MDFRKALRNTHRKLKVGGVFRFVLPDLEFYVRKYIDDPSSSAALIFMRETNLGYEQRGRSLRDFILSWLGNSQHLWMWDYKSLEQELKDSGFKDIRRAEYGDSSDPLFRDVEDESRWENCLGVECRK